MICFNKMWKTTSKCKRKIMELEYKDINLNEYIIIDVRTKREFNEYHLNNSTNIPLSEIAKNINKYINNKERKILLCCEYGVRSKKATEILINLGYTQVYNLKGGLENI